MKMWQQIVHKYMYCVYNNRWFLMCGPSKSVWRDLFQFPHMNNYCFLSDHSWPWGFVSQYTNRIYKITIASEEDKSHISSREPLTSLARKHNSNFWKHVLNPWAEKLVKWKPRNRSWQDLVSAETEAMNTIKTLLVKKTSHLQYLASYKSRQHFH